MKRDREFHLNETRCDSYKKNGVIVLVCIMELLRPAFVVLAQECLKSMEQI